MSSLLCSVGTEELYKKCDCGSTPVLSLLGDAKVLNFSPFFTQNLSATSNSIILEVGTTDIDT
jgi:hypothetical protein